jgi:hypothetical protein
MKKCSTSSAIRKMSIKTILRFYLIPVRIAIFKKTNNNKCWQREGRITLIYYWWKYKLVQ